MANLRLSEVVLTDRWPGPVNPHLGIPKEGWDGTEHSGVTAPAYPVGTKIMAYTDNSHCPGWYTMYYGNLAAISDTNYGISEDFSDGKCWCGHCCLTADVSEDGDPTYLIALSDGTYQPAYVMHQCTTEAVTDLSNGGGACIPCCTLDGYEYGWFWVGGVCPCKDVTVMADNDYASSEGGIGVDMTTDGTVKKGQGFYLTCNTASEVELSGEFSLCIGVSNAGENIYARPVGYAMGPDV